MQGPSMFSYAHCAVQSLRLKALIHAIPGRTDCNVVLKTQYDNAPSRCSAESFMPSTSPQGVHPLLHDVETTQYVPVPPVDRTILVCASQQVVDRATVLDTGT